FDALAKLHAERSHAVVNEHVSPTSDFLRDPDMNFPADAMKAVISEETGPGKTDFVEATGTATQLLGDAVGSNMFLLGYAWQRGLVPVGREAIFKAIEVNNVAVAFNKQAFSWGRVAAHDPDAVRSRLAEPVEPFRPLDKLDDIIDDRAGRLEQYQNAGYANEYRMFVDKVRRAEAVRVPGGERLAKAVARSLFKLMAYKDEYEVARLFAGGDFIKRLDQQMQGDYSLQFHMAPPLLARRDPDTGRPLKRAFPGWTLHVFKALAALKFLRGTPLDPFGYTRERKLERRLIREYRETIEGLLEDLDPDNIELSMRIAELPMQMRGFGHVKRANIDKAKAEGKRLLAQRRA
ncbi:MAG TPA: DUF6537 domain-containing protein, partial [Arenicellales bacterium]|nr:DUF6537 domain-containing protein [Arenicellales bacterium]